MRLMVGAVGVAFLAMVAVIVYQQQRTREMQQRTRQMMAEMDDLRVRVEAGVGAGETVCPIHGERLRQDIVPIRYGLPMKDTWHEAYNKSRFTEFRYSLTWLGGGCVDDGVKKARVLYCPKCREAEAIWLKEHPFEEDIVFSINATNVPQATTIRLVGDFNNWDSESSPMREINGEWRTWVHLLPGRHQYKFIVDGKLIPDPENPDQIDDGKGGKNSVFVVGR
jgi:hypothetical protein